MLSMKNIRKIYRTDLIETHALDGVSVDVAAGEFVAVMGRSGSGKTTFLNIAGLLDTFDQLGWDLVELVLADPNSWDRPCASSSASRTAPARTATRGKPGKPARVETLTRMMSEEDELRLTRDDITAAVHFLKFRFQLEHFAQCSCSSSEPVDQSPSPPSQRGFW